MSMTGLWYVLTSDLWLQIQDDGMTLRYNPYSWNKVSLLCFFTSFPLLLGNTIKCLYSLFPIQNFLNGFKYLQHVTFLIAN